jgi:AbrB family looped-hinge helix DNA binding protein
MPFGSINGMTISISVDKAGRVVLPQNVRRQFNLMPGDKLDLEVTPDGIMLRSRSGRGAVVEENGLLVHEGEAVGDLAEAVDLVRAGRDADLLGLRRS